METLGAMSTSDFPYILANVNSKYMLAAYAEVESRWKELSRQRNATDFKTQYPTLVWARRVRRSPKTASTSSGLSGRAARVYAVKTYGNLRVHPPDAHQRRHERVLGFPFAQGMRPRTRGEPWWALVTANAQMADGQTCSARRTTT